MVSASGHLLDGYCVIFNDRVLKCENKSRAHEEGGGAVSVYQHTHPLSTVHELFLSGRERGRQEGRASHQSRERECEDMQKYVLIKRFQ